MQRHLSHPAVALVVDAYSTGQFYPAALREKGLSPVHVSSGTERGAPGLAAYLAQAAEHLEGDFEARHHDWVDLDDLLARLAALRPVCVMAGCEIGVEMTDILAERLSLPGNAPSGSHVRRDKLAMHETLAACGLPYLRSLATDDLEAAEAFAVDLGFWPVVVKPLRSAATEGVRLCRDSGELRAAFGALLGSVTMFGDQNARVLVQECAIGREFAVNTVSRDGRHVLSDLWEYRKVPSPGGAPLYDRTLLVREPGDEHRAVLDYAWSVLDALGIRFGPAHVE
ncbi:MAG TPA: ATP-grasp domain-containing protein, partial [Holophaga sp.]|nr:ATP-grasp domain-containing protein [Holophaga sp.]